MARFTVDTHLFRELGELLVGRDSTALIELVKNSYDADASLATIHIEKNRIVVVLKLLRLLREPSVHRMPSLMGERVKVGKHVFLVVH